MRYFWAVLLMVACHFTPQSKYLDEARRYSKDQDWSKAAYQYEKVMRVDPDSELALEASREASRVALIHLKDDQLVANFLKHIVDHTPDHSERVTAQKNLAQVYLEKINNYPRAVIEINRAISFTKAASERGSLRLMLARAYSFLRDFSQARSEIDQLILEEEDPELRFRARLLKANILQNEKKFTEAVVIYRDLLATDPDRSQNDQVALSLSVVLEEQESFDEAIAVLEKVKVGYKVPEMIDLKIRRLKERKAQAPGARGLRK